MTPTTPILPLSPERLTFWQEAIKKARQKRKDISEKHDWDGNLERYEPQPKRKRGKRKINIGVDFSDVEQKKAALVFDTPSVSLTDVSTGLESAVAVHQELLNELLGPQHADVLPTVLKAVFDCLCPSGVGPVLVGYHCTTQPTKILAPQLDPMTQQPAVDPLTMMPLPDVEQMQDIPIHEKWFVSKLSAKALLLPSELRDTNFQKTAGWIGHDWQKPVSQVRRDYNLPDDWNATGDAQDKPYFERDDKNPDEGAGDPLVSGATIWYRAALEPSTNGQVVHPERIRVLTLADSAPKPLEHRDSPDQTFDGEGRLTPDSVIGFNVRPLVLRDLSDSAWVPSDCAVTGGLTDEQQTYRQMALNKRDTNVSAIAYETRAGMQEALEKAQKDTQGGTVWVPVPEGTLAGNPVMVQMAQAVQGRETYLDQELIRADRARVLAMDSNQSGTNTPTKRTATESSIVQRNTDARFEQERQRVLRWYLDLVRAFDALVLRYCDQRMAVQILGPQKGQAWFAAKPNLIGGYRYSLQVDSGKYLDVEAARREMINIINFAAKAPEVNKMELWKKFAEKFGYDPATFLVQPQPPRPEPPKIQLSFNGVDLASPQGPVVLAILQHLGVQIDPAAVAAMQQAVLVQAQQQLVTAAVGDSAKAAEHGGGAEKPPRIDQHSADITGQLDGMGQGTRVS